MPAGHATTPHFLKRSHPIHPIRLQDAKIGLNQTADAIRILIR
jgi:hypothetical protein